MKINNKFEIGAQVYYPAADLSMPQLIESKIRGVMYIPLEDGDPEDIGEIFYVTEHTYRIKESDVCKTKGTAKKKLLKFITEHRKNLNGQIDAVYDKLKGTKPNDLIQKAPLDEEEDTEE